MIVSDKVVVVTGAGSGIGAAMARRFTKERPRALILADLNIASVEEVAAETGAIAVGADVSRPQDNDRLIAEVEERFGPVDLFCANAGIGFAGDEQTAPEDWDRMWQVT